MTTEPFPELSSKTSHPEMMVMSSAGRAANSALSELLGGISSSRLLEKQKIAAVTVSNLGIGRGLWSVPRAWTILNIIRRCS